MRSELSEVVVHPVEAGLPDGPILLGPGRHLLERPCVEGAGTELRSSTAYDQAGQPAGRPSGQTATTRSWGRGGERRLDYPWRHGQDGQLRKGTDSQREARLDADLTVEPRASVSPLHRDLRFAPAGSARYKDHLLLTTKNVPAPYVATTRAPTSSALTSFQVRFTDQLPDKIANARFVDWCADRLEELLPVHRWLVAHITTSPTRS